jgi:type I restriction enzyme S subunit
MAVKPGYKQTEVGMIPEDWGNPQLTDIAKEDSPICYGIVQVGPNSRNGIPVLAIKNLNSDYASNIHQASVEKERPYARSRIRPDDVLVSVKGTTGRVGIVPQGFHGNISRDLARLRLREGTVPRFCFQMLQSDLVQRRLAVAVVGTTRMDLSIAILKQVRIPLPPTKGEQEAIAEILSDADALIESLEQLIAKKRLIKQGAMQELLTGKKRLPGFRGEWEVKQLGLLGAFRGGSGFPIKYQGDTDGDYPFFKVSDMNNEANSTFMISSNNWIRERTRKEIGAKILPANSIVFAKIGAAIFLERKKILFQESCVDNNMMGFVLNGDAAHYRFVHYLFQNIQLGKLIAATALPSLNGRDIAALESAIPPVSEQTAIASVLSDMDAEIAALEAKLTKTRALKQGMMQELLTGRTRLI